MFNPRRYKFASNVALLALCGLSIGTAVWFWSLTQKSGPSEQTPPQHQRRSVPLLDGFSYQGHDADGLVHLLTGEDLKINPRRLLFFNAKHLNELTLTNARLKTYLRKGEPAGPDLTSLASFSFSENNRDKSNLRWPTRFGVVTRQVIVNLTQEIFQDEQLKMVVRAKTVYIEPGKDTVEYRDVSLMDPHSQSRIVSRKALWDKQKHLFKIPGAYLLRTPNNQERGTGISVSFDFKVESLIGNVNMEPLPNA